jgi:hypothetical protein
VFFDLRNVFLTHRKDIVKKWKKFPDKKNKIHLPYLYNRFQQVAKIFKRIIKFFLKTFISCL